MSLRRLAMVSLALVMAAAPAFRGRTSFGPTVAAREARFVETITESGTIVAARLRIYSARLAGTPAKIAELAPEASSVSAGDLLVRFDATGLLQSLQKEEAALRVAHADLTRVREELRVEQLRVQGELDAAGQEQQSAERELASEVDGRGRLADLEARAAAAEAGRELERARRTFADITAMLAEGFVTRLEVDRSEQAVRRAEEQERIAQIKLDSLTRFERPAAIEKSKARASAARQNATRAAEGAEARVTQRQALVAIAAGRVTEIDARIALLRSQIAETTIRADGPGLVVYRDLFFGTEKRKPQVGDEVWPNQPIIALPDSSQLVVETRVREVDLHKVSASQHVSVRVDAYPELRIPAAVALVGALAAQDDSRAGTKAFPVTVTLRESDPRLRTGMTARVEIEVVSLPRALVVPVRAVFEHDGQPVCYVLRDGRPERRAIVIAGDNGTDVAVTAGVQRDELVLLADPRTAP